MRLRNYSVTGDVIELENLSTRADGSIADRKEVTPPTVSCRIDGDELSYSLQVRASGNLQGHLAAVPAALSSTSVELCHRREQTQPWAPPSGLQVVWINGPLPPG